MILQYRMVSYVCLRSFPISKSKVSTMNSATLLFRFYFLCLPPTHPKSRVKEGVRFLFESNWPLMTRGLATSTNCWLKGEFNWEGGTRSSNIFISSRRPCWGQSSWIFLAFFFYLLQIFDSPFRQTCRRVHFFVCYELA